MRYETSQTMALPYELAIREVIAAIYGGVNPETITDTVETIADEYCTTYAIVRDDIHESMPPRDVEYRISPAVKAYYGEVWFDTISGKAYTDIDGAIA